MTIFNEWSDARRLIKMCAEEWKYSVVIYTGAG